MNIAVDERGVVMAEAVIVIPFLIICWMGFSALHELYVARLHAENETASQVLQMAMSGSCTDHVREEIPGAPALEQETSDMLSRIGNNNPLVLAHSNASVTQNLSHEFWQREASDATVRGKRILMCNTVPADNLMALIANQVKEWLNL
ncbi:MAG: hypothetical protein M0R76_07095 [Proteobacteria bacterium]|nr:hypothetical protein [Pseudomonadota bacterium]